MKGKCLDCPCFENKIGFQGKEYCYCIVNREKREVELYYSDSCKTVRYNRYNNLQEILVGLVLANALT